MVRFLTILFSLFIANQVNAAPAARAVMENIPTISSINASGFFGPLVGNVVGNLDGTATSATSALSVPTGGVNLSTVTVALAGKVDINTPAQVNLSTVTTALALKVDKNSPDQVNLSTVTTALATKVDKNTPEQVNLSTVTTAIALKASLAGATFTGASGITNQSFTATGPNGSIISGASVTASAFFGNGSALSGVAVVAGIDTDVQFNDGGVSGGSSGFFSWNKTNRWLGIGGTPAAHLTVYGANTDALTTMARFQKGVYGSGYLRQSYTDAGNWGWILNGDESSSPQFKFDFANGRLGLAKNNPSATLDVNGISVFGSGGTRSTFTATGALDMSPGYDITLNGNGKLIGYSSVTASAFFGNGSALTGVTDSSKVAKVGDTMTGRLTAPDYTATYGLTASTGSFSGSVTASSGTFQDALAVKYAGSPAFTVRSADGLAYFGPIPNTSDVVPGGAVFGAANLFILGDSTSHNGHAIIFGKSNGGRYATVSSRWLTGDKLIELGNGSASFFGIGADGTATATYGVIASSAGIGTASPATTLDVNGNAQFGSGATKSTFTATGNLTVAAAAYITVGDAKVSSELFASTSNSVYLRAGSGSGSVHINDGSNGTTYISEAGTGAVRIMTATGTQLYYCSGGTYDGHIGRGASMVCTGGAATALGIYVP